MIIRFIKLMVFCRSENMQIKVTELLNKVADGSNPRTIYCNEVKYVFDGKQYLDENKNELMQVLMSDGYEAFTNAVATYQFYVLSGKDKEQINSWLQALKVANIVSLSKCEFGDEGCSLLINFDNGAFVQTPKTKDELFNNLNLGEEYERGDLNL